MVMGKCSILQPFLIFMVEIASLRRVRMWVLCTVLDREQKEQIAQAFATLFLHCDSVGGHLLTKRSTTLSCWSR